MTSKFINWFLLWVIILHLSFRNVLGINRDGVALIAFKTAILEDPQGSLDNWNASEETPCAWNGILCTQIGHDKELRVVGIIIPKRQLVGIIPSVLGALVYLRRVNMRHNRLNRSLPRELFNAGGLQSLIFNGNSLTGPLPEEIGKLRYLQNLDLSFNSFVGIIPPAINNCTRLRRLVLNNKIFRGCFLEEWETVSPFSNSWTYHTISSMDPFLLILVI